ncbi:glyoxylase-like metal-dependent hydrolase (beta-lactamase superfamily II) [Pedobacter sp. CAN_A7]|uniref:MBL fold metallo-hydrolase n=1 Tax=Pedobacter sp. CAN_A7 TaxID=2787722 RepID=UPI0018CA35B8
MEEHKYTEIAPGIWGLKIVFVNIYMVTTGPEEWVLVDGGVRGSACRIKKMAADLFGEDNPPAAIVLTHGHFDHIGALHELLKTWKVQVYAHQQEIPYLTGHTSYPPADPSVGGGLMSAMSFMYPNSPINLGTHVHALAKNGTLPHMPDWQYIHTPGHTPGHISLFRGRDKVLLAGDAFVTTQAESAFNVLTNKKQLSGPPKYFTPNWVSAALSVRKLKDLRPAVAATGHGPTMQGEELASALEHLVEHFAEIAIPKHGRYVNDGKYSGLSKTVLGAVVVLSAALAFTVVRGLKNR